MYRNDEKKQDADKWQGWADLFQFGSLGGLFVMIFILESVSKQTARTLVWYLGGFLFITATIGFFLSRVALKKEMAYLNAEGKRVGGLLDEAIEAAKKGAKS